MDNLKQFLVMHNPAAKLEQMVYEVWEDGEITLTKGGDLYRQRNLHVVSYPDPSARPFDYTQMPCKQAAMAVFVS